jgi:hypothetical protein
VLFEQGRALLAQGAVNEACAKLEESLRLDRGIGTMLYLAECWQRAGRTASAWAQFREAADVAGKEGDPRAKIAREHAERLAPTLSTLTIRVAVPAPGLEIVRDGRAVGRALWGTDVPIDPGEHLVRATAAGFKAWDGRVSVRPDADHAVLQVPPLEELPRGPAEPPPTVTTTRTWQRVLGAGLAAVGVGGIVVGTAYGLSAIKKNDRADFHCGNLGCDPEGIDAGDQARRQSTISTIGFVAGGVFLAAGVIVFFTATSTRPVRVGAEGLRFAF